MQAPRLLRRLVPKQGAARTYQTGGHHHQPLVTYNDLPSPQGSWRTHYDAKQRKYNARLALGVGTLAGTLVFGRAVGFLDFSKYRTPTEIGPEVENYRDL